ncbi:MAG: hypothetical protein M0Z43_00745 [Acidithiobacillus sp.]|nr:hypothetical protein [Acidithiobacillus sp.]
MKKVAIAFSTKDRVELSKQSIKPLLQPDKFSLLWVDGSRTSEGEALWQNYPSHARIGFRGNVRNGADAAIVYALTELLNLPTQPDYVGLCENDVLLDPDWFDKTMALFERGADDGLKVGAVSSRTYEDRILLQRDGYAVCHNLGAGHIILTRQAAKLILKYYRNGWTLENRRVFCHLSDQDIGAYWAFRGSGHMLSADWQFDRIIAAHGLASLGLTPVACEMIGQEPSLEKQGLKLVKEQGSLCSEDIFYRYVERTKLIRDGILNLPCTLPLLQDEGSHIWFPHQLQYLDGGYEGNWHTRWSQGWGPFLWVSEEDAVIYAPVSGPCVLMVSGGEKGGKIRIEDNHSGFDQTFDVAAEGANRQMAQFNIPAAVAYRTLKISFLTPGTVFWGLIMREPQPCISDIRFNYSWLPQGSRQ